MAHASIWLRKFDRDAEFMVFKQFVLNGIEQRPGEVFDKTKCSTRMLRKLYEQRRVRMTEKSAQAAAPVPVEELPPGEDVPSMEDLPVVVATIKHAGFGKYQVMIGETVVSAGSLTKDEAQKQADELNAAP